MHRVERRAHLLTVGHLSAEQGAELQEGAQEQRAADWRGGHGGGSGHRRTAAMQLPGSAAQSFSGETRLR